MARNGALRRPDHSSEGPQRNRRNGSGDFWFLPHQAGALAAGESIAKNLFEGSCDARWRYSAIVSPVPPASTGKSLSFGRPSRMGSTVSA